MELFSRLLLGLALAVTLHALEIPYDFHVKCTPENAIFGYFSATKKPVLTVKSGAVVRIDGGGGRIGSRRPAGGAGASAPGPETDEERNQWFKDNGIALTIDSPIVSEHRGGFSRDAGGRHHARHPRHDPQEALRDRRELVLVSAAVSRKCAVEIRETS